MKFTKHVLDALAKVNDELMSKWKSPQLTVKFDEKHKVAPKGTEVPVGGIEISWFYFLYGVKIRKSSAWEKIKQCERI